MFLLITFFCNLSLKPDIDTMLTVNNESSSTIELESRLADSGSKKLKSSSTVQLESGFTDSGTLFRLSVYVSDFTSTSVFVLLLASDSIDTEMLSFAGFIIIREVVGRLDEVKKLEIFIDEDESHISSLYSTSFQPVLHDLCNKGCGMCNPVCWMVHVKEPLLLIGKSSP